VLSPYPMQRRVPDMRSPPDRRTDALTLLAARCPRWACVPNGIDIIGAHTSSCAMFPLLRLRYNPQIRLDRLEALLIFFPGILVGNGRRDDDSDGEAA